MFFTDLLFRRRQVIQMSCWVDYMHRLGLNMIRVVDLLLYYRRILEGGVHKIVQ